MKSVAFIALMAFVALHPQMATAAERRLCLTTSGQVFARKTCSTSETVLTLSHLANAAAASVQPLPGTAGPAGLQGLMGPIGESGQVGPHGPKGLTNILAGPRGVIDFSACHRIISGPAFVPGQVTLTANCDSVNEFLFSDEWSISGNTAFIQSVTRNLSLGSNNELLPYGVSVMTNLTGGGDYSVTVKALCCPR